MAIIQGPYFIRKISFVIFLHCSAIYVGSWLSELCGYDKLT
jgi:hypothetical protein